MVAVPCRDGCSVCQCPTYVVKTLPEHKKGRELHRNASACLPERLPPIPSPHACVQFGFEGSGEEGFGSYYHTSRTRQLTQRFGDMRHKIQDLEVTHRLRKVDGMRRVYSATTLCGCSY